MTPRNARLAVVTAALLFSTGGVAIKMTTFSGTQISALRSGVAAVALALWVRRRLTYHRSDSVKFVSETQTPGRNRA